MVFKVLTSLYFASMASQCVFAAAPSPFIQFIGRVPTPPEPQIFTWAYTGIRFAFIGTTANFTFSSTGQNGLVVSIDGSDISSANTTKTLLDSSITGSNVSFNIGKLSKGPHTVEIIRATETYHGTITFGGVETDGRFISLAAPKRRIEFIGDSITTGYGADGALPCSDSALTENAAKTYASLTGKNLSADISLVAWSGRGVMRNYPGSDGSDPYPTMPSLWRQTSGLDTSPTYTFPKAVAPHVVVINLGTNDFAYLNGPADSDGNPTASRPPLTQEQYQTAIANFTTQVQAVYPAAKIFLVSSPMLSDGWPVGQNQHSTQLAGLKVAASGFKNVFVVDLPPQTGDLGCDYHPSPATHQQMADILAPVIKKQLGW